MFYGLHPIGFNAMYSQNCDVHSHDTRTKNNLHVAVGHGDLYAKSFYCTSITFAKQHDILFNVSKSQLLWFGKSKKPINISLKMENGEVIPYVHSYTSR